MYVHAGEKYISIKLTQNTIYYKDITHDIFKLANISIVQHIKKYSIFKTD